MSYNKMKNTESSPFQRTQQPIYSTETESMKKTPY